MDISKQDDAFRIAKQVEKLVSDPAIMQYWQQKVASTLKRPEVSIIKNFEAVEDYKVNDKLFQKRTSPENLWRASRDEVDVLLQKWLSDFDPKTDIDVLYTLLAFYHDSRLPIRHIVDDDIKKQSPVFCEWMSLYYARGILIRPNMAIFPSQSEQCTVEQCLDVYLSHVKRDLERTYNPAETSPASSGKADLPNEKPAEIERGDEWIKVSEAAEILSVNTGTVTRWANKGQIKDNEKKGRKRRVLKSSVLFLKQSREDSEVLKDAKELRKDTGTIPDRH